MSVAENRPSSKGSWTAVILGLAVAGVFLYFTFRSLDLKAVGGILADTPWGLTFGMTGVAVFSVFLRGIRWWLLMPGEWRPGSFWSAQRALWVSYGVHNVASRVGELVRLILFQRATKRDFAAVASTLLVDRFMFDVMAFALLLLITIAWFREPLTTIAPDVMLVVQPFLVGTLIGVVGLVVLAVAPVRINGLVHRMGLSRLPWIGPKLENLIHQLSEGVSVLASPKRLLALQALNLAIWSISAVYISLGLAAFDLPSGVGVSLFVYTAATLGMIVPSPGGVGATHYFVSAAVVTLMSVTQLEAAAFATYVHGVNYLAITLVALIAFVVGAWRR